MAFKVDDIIIDRIQMAVAEDFQGNPLYTLTQLSDATLSITAESVDATDKDGTLIKRFWRGKTGTFEATNAMLNLNVIGAMSGSNKQEATGTNVFRNVPGLKIAKQEEDTVELTDVVGTPKVNGLFNNGTLGATFATGGSASASTFVWDDSTGTLTLPLSNDYEQYLITYERDITENAVGIYNKADKFPGTVRLILKVLCVEPCSADTLRAAYLVLPSFQVSPEVEVTFSSEGTITYSGDLQVGQH